MNQFKIILVLLLIAYSQSVQLRRSDTQQLIQSLQEVKKLSDQGNQFFNMIQLHLNRGGKVDQVIEYVEKALTDTIQDRSTAQEQKTVELDQLDNSLTGLRNDQRDLSQEQSQTVQRINSLNENIEIVGNRIANLENELTQLNERSQLIESARQTDLESFQIRQSRDLKALYSLNDIILTLKQLQEDSKSNQQLIQKSKPQITQALKKVSDSLSALVELSSGLNQAKLDIVIRKLIQIQQGIKESKKIDEQEEEKSEGRYKELVEQISILRGEKSFSLEQAQSELEQDQAQKNQAESRNESLLSLIDSTNKLLQSTQATRDTTETIYNNKIQSLSNSVDALKTAKEILQQGIQSESEDQLSGAPGLF